MLLNKSGKQYIKEKEKQTHPTLLKLVAVCVLTDTVLSQTEYMYILYIL
jgi:hypothetical protein